MAVSQSNQVGAFVPTNFIWDVQQLQQVDIKSPEFKELLVRMYQNIGLMAEVLNVKTTGQFPLAETVDGNLYFPNPANNSSTVAYPAERQEFRQTYLRTNVAGAVAFNHNITITPKTTFTRIYATANDIVGNNYYPIPWASAAGATNIEIKVNATQVVITNNSGITFDIVYVVLAYLQS